MRTGTSHFVSQDKAIDYYATYYTSYAETAEAVEAKLAEGEIHIGPPKVGPSEKLTIIDGGTRYAIESR